MCIRDRTPPFINLGGDIEGGAGIDAPVCYLRLPCVACRLYTVYVYGFVLMLEHLEKARAIFPPFPVPGFTPNFTGYDLDQHVVDWYDMYLRLTPNDSLAHVRQQNIFHV